MSEPIKTMKLYTGVGRVFNELRELGIADDAPLRVEDLVRFDQYHYEGITAVNEAITRCNIQANHHVLEVGSGIGGPARYMAHTTGCRVTAVELQADLNETATHLTSRCGLANQVTHVQGDFLAQNFGGGFDTVASWLAFLHISDKRKLLARCFAELKPGGHLFIEDFSRLGQFTPAEEEDLQVKVYCEDVPTPDEYQALLREAGFTNVAYDDKTASWAAFVNDRFTAFRADIDRHTRVHGEEIVAGLDDFYDAMNRLYQGDNLGGIRLLARKP
ncbi:MAG: methyltransferase domain-containing protein [Chloroflexota bacterium]